MNKFIWYISMAFIYGLALTGVVFSAVFVEFDYGYISSRIFAFAGLGLIIYNFLNLGKY